MLREPNLALELLTRLSPYPQRLKELERDMGVTHAAMLELVLHLRHRGFDVRRGQGRASDMPTTPRTERSHCVWVHPDGWPAAEREAERYYDLTTTDTEGFDHAA